MRRRIVRRVLMSTCLDASPDEVLSDDTWALRGRGRNQICPQSRHLSGDLADMPWDRALAAAYMRHVTCLR